MEFPSHFAALVGAPRCGTTALSRYLARHPGICFSSVKEPHFFTIHDLRKLTLPKLAQRIGEDYLQRYFAGCDRRKLLMEGSISYLYGADRMLPILKLWPDAKFVIAVRDPFEMLPSVHQRLLYNGDETVTDFSKAWRLTKQRRRGRKIPRTCVDPRLLDYEEVARLGKHVGQFFESVGRERCFVSVYDDFAADPAAQYHRVLAFLGLPDDGQSDFTPRRATQGYKIGWLQRLLKRPPKATLFAGEKFRQRIKPLDGEQQPSTVVESVLSLRKRLLDWNKMPAERAQLPPKLQTEIRHALAGDVARLGELLGRDLSHWLGGQGARPNPN